MKPDAAPPSIAANYFDGVSARARRVRLHMARGQLWISGERSGDRTDPIAFSVPTSAVQWPERTRHGLRTAHLRDGGSLQALDAAAWDAWARASGLGESAVVRAQQNWRATAIAVVLLLVLAGAGYQWGVPWMARVALAALPPSVDRSIGSLALRSFEGPLLAPSTVPAARQAALRAAFDRAVRRAHAEGDRPAYELRFYASPKNGLGPNAFALPGGAIVVTDELVRLLADRDDVLIGVLGHELGHVRQRHGMRLLLQTAVIGTAASLAWGDFSWLLAAGPAVLGQNAYSRDFERDADGEAITLLRANGLSPAVMIELFDRLAARRVFDTPPGGNGKAAGTDVEAARKRDGTAARDASGDSPNGAPGGASSRPPGFDLGIALASHPADAERIQRFREAAQR